MLHQLPQPLLEHWQKLGFDQPTDIQSAIFTPIQEGKNLLAISPTGTGKTLAYLLPCLCKLQAKKAQQLLILAPNSELAGQLFDVTKTWAEPLGLTAQVFLSGSSQKRQIERLKKGPEILIGTAGRIWELIALKKIKPMAIDTIVLDEFDELLADSQLTFVTKITHHVPKNHQLIYLSATNHIDSRYLAADTMTVDLSGQQLDHITHYYIRLDKRERLDFLRKCSHIPEMRALVFFNQLSDLGAVEERLQFQDTSVMSLASDVNVKSRKIILNHFKEGNLSLLLATDLVARGIDIDDLELVINFEVPRDKATYTHRAGRTGRMGKAGAVMTLISHKEELKTLKKYAQVEEVFLKNQTFYTK